MDRRPPHGQRLARSAGASALAALALLLGRRVIPRLADVLAARFATKIAPSEKVTWEVADPAKEMALVLSFGLALAFLVLGVGLAIAIHKLLERRGNAKASAAASIAASLAAIGFAFTESRGLGVCVATFVSMGTALGVPYAGIGRTHPRPTRPHRLAMAALLGEAFAATWAAWLIASPRGLGPLIVAPIVLAIAVAFARIGIVLSRGAGSDALSLDAVAGSPLLALPLLGLLRAPSPLWAVAAVALGLVLRLLVSNYGSPERALRWIAFVALPFSLGMVVFIPLTFRGLTTENYLSHEGFHAGWINSVYHGKWLMADAGFIYGPLREYALAAILALFGPTLEHLRVTHLLINAIGFALLLGAAQQLARGRLALQLWLVYVALVATALRTFVMSTYYLCFGWADLLRSALPAFALVNAVRAIAQLPGSGPTPRRALVRIGAWGFVIGCAFLYSQEYGLVALLAIAVTSLLHRGASAEGPPLARSRAAIATTALVVGAALLPFVLLFSVYAIAGRAGPLLREVLHFGALVGGGKMNAYPMPVTAESFRDPWGMVHEFVHGQTADKRYHDAPIQFVIAAGVTFVSAIVLLLRAAWGGRWSARDSMMLALTLFTAGTYRITLSRGDVYHILSGTTGACLLAVTMLADVSTLRIRSRAWPRLRIPACVLVVFPVIAFSIFAGESIGILRLRADAIASGEYGPASAVRYDNAPISRAGDELVTAGTKELVEYIQKNTQPRDPIFCRIDMLRGGEFYFLANRRNATRYDTIHEITTPAMMRDVTESLQGDPPVLVIGSDEAYIGPEASTYLREAYDAPMSVGGLSVARRKKPN